MLNNRNVHSPSPGVLYLSYSSWQSREWAIWDQAPGFRAFLTNKQTRARPSSPVAFPSGGVIACNVSSSLDDVCYP
jgi:hypothetical protein